MSCRRVNLFPSKWFTLFNIFIFYQSIFSATVNMENEYGDPNDISPDDDDCDTNYENFSKMLHNRSPVPYMLNKFHIKIPGYGIHVHHLWSNIYPHIMKSTGSDVLTEDVLDVSMLSDPEYVKSIQIKQDIERTTSINFFKKMYEKTIQVLKDLGFRENENLLYFNPSDPAIGPNTLQSTRHDIFLAPLYSDDLAARCGKYKILEPQITDRYDFKNGYEQYRWLLIFPELSYHSACVWHVPSSQLRILAKSQRTSLESIDHPMFRFEKFYMFICCVELFLTSSITMDARPDMCFNTKMYNPDMMSLHMLDNRDYYYMDFGNYMKKTIHSSSFQYITKTINDNQISLQELGFQSLSISNITYEVDTLAMIEFKLSHVGSPGMLSYVFFKAVGIYGRIEVKYFDRDMKLIEVSDDVKNCISFGITESVFKPLRMYLFIENSLNLGGIPAYHRRKYSAKKPIRATHNQQQQTQKIQSNVYEQLLFDEIICGRIQLPDEPQTSAKEKLVRFQDQTQEEEQNMDSDSNVLESQTSTDYYDNDMDCDNQHSGTNSFYPPINYSEIFFKGQGYPNV